MGTSAKVMAMAMSAAPVPAAAMNAAAAVERMDAKVAANLSVMAAQTAVAAVNLDVMAA